MKICQDIRLRDFSVDTGAVPLFVLSELETLRLSCTQLSVHVTCERFVILPVMQALGELLVQLNIRPMLIDILNRLASCAELCTKFQEFQLSVRDDCVERLIQLLMPGIGGTLRRFELCVAPGEPFNGLEYGPLVQAPIYVPFLKCTARCTSNLRRFEVEYLNPNVSYRPVALANPGLRRVSIYLEPFMYHAQIGRPNVVEDWVVSTLCDFLNNCPKFKTSRLIIRGQTNAARAVSGGKWG